MTTPAPADQPKRTNPLYVVGTVLAYLLVSALSILDALGDRGDTAYKAGEVAGILLSPVAAVGDRVRRRSRAGESAHDRRDVADRDVDDRRGGGGPVQRIHLAWTGARGACGQDRDLGQRARRARRRSDRHPPWIVRGETNFRAFAHGLRETAAGRGVDVLLDSTAWAGGTGEYQFAARIATGVYIQIRCLPHAIRGFGLVVCAMTGSTAPHDLDFVRTGLAFTGP